VIGNKWWDRVLLVLLMAFRLILPRCGARSHTQAEIPGAYVGRMNDQRSWSRKATSILGGCNFRGSIAELSFPVTLKSVGSIQRRTSESVEVEMLRRGSMH
jgi:hypothetical protein